MIQNAPWVTLSEALTAGQMFPLDSKTYDFIRDLMDTYQARPIESQSFSALVNMMLPISGGEISGSGATVPAAKEMLHNEPDRAREERVS